MPMVAVLTVEGGLMAEGRAGEGAEGADATLGENFMKGEEPTKGEDATEGADHGFCTGAAAICTKGETTTLFMQAVFRQVMKSLIL